MKKLLLFLIVSIAIFSCKKEDSKSCYEFTTKIVTSVSPNIAGYPQTTTSTTEQCGLNPVEAKQVADDLTTTSHSTQSNYTITVTQTCTYHLK